MNDGGQRKNMGDVMTIMATISLDAFCLLTKYRYKHFSQTLNFLSLHPLKNSAQFSSFR
jgi:hypothetical protein